MIRRPPRSTQSRSSAASDVYKRQGAEVLVHQDAVGGADCESSVFGNLRVRSYADGEDNYVCCKLCPAGQGYRQHTVHVLRKRFDSITQVQVDTMDLQFLMSVGSNVW